MIVSPSEPWLRLALKESRRSRNRAFWHCAVITKGSNILAVASNRDTTHAEIAALRQLGKGGARNTECLSLRFTLTDRLTNARPCPECEAALRDAGVKRCLYSMPFNRMEKLNLCKSDPTIRPRYRTENYRVAEMRMGW